MIPKEKWLLCAPHYFDVRYEINPWMNLQRAPDRSVAHDQWNYLVEQFTKLPVELQFADQQSDWPDMVFTANAGLVYRNKVVLSAFRHAERQGEEPLFEEWFIRHGYEVVRLKSGSFEGEGDALFAGHKLFCGYGFRSDLSAYEEIGAIYNLRDVITCQLVNPSFYHLDTCFCPISEKEALCVLSAFDRYSIKLLEDNISIIPIEMEDASRFACNSVIVGLNAIVPAGCEATSQILRERGFTVYPVEMTEFMKAGGAAKCLSLRLSNG